MTVRGWTTFFNWLTVFSLGVTVGALAVKAVYGIN